MRLGYMGVCRDQAPIQGLYILNVTLYPRNLGVPGCFVTTLVLGTRKDSLTVTLLGDRPKIVFPSPSKGGESAFEDLTGFNGR